MKPYQVDTMSRAELRRCYNRYDWAVLLLYPAGQVLAVGIVILENLLLPGWPSDAFRVTLHSALLNAFAAYVPTALLFLLLLRRFPRAERLPVDRLDLWEFIQALMFTLGLCFLLNLLTLGLGMGLERCVGLPSVNRVAEHDALSPLWEQLLFSVLIPPVCEELLFRRLLLDRLRPLGDVSAVWLSALAFSLYHMNFYQMFYAFGLGAFFAVVVLLTGSIRDTILLHMCLNGLTVLNMTLGNQTFSLFYTLFLCLCSGVTVVFLVTKRGHIHMESGPLHLSARDKRRACLRSVWFWIMLLSGIVCSTAIIFPRS